MWRFHSGTTSPTRPGKAVRSAASCGSDSVAFVDWVAGSPAFERSRKARAESATRTTTPHARPVQVLPASQVTTPQLKQPIVIGTTRLSRALIQNFLTDLHLPVGCFGSCCYAASDPIESAVLALFLCVYLSFLKG